MLNIVIPMAGRGSRFQTEGYTLPKPLIGIHGKPMISLVINNLKVPFKHRFIFICLQEHIERFHIDQEIKKLTPHAVIIPITDVTQGAACTVLLSKSLIDAPDPLMIANSDQWVDIPITDYLRKMDDGKLDGLIMTMTAHDPKWSFIRLNARNEITEVVEKVPVSNEATVGIYNFRKGSDFVQAAEQMIKRNLRVNNEFYVAPTYNQLIEQGRKIGFYNIGRDAEKMHGLGTPSDLESFIQSPISKKAVQF